MAINGFIIPLYVNPPDPTLTTLLGLMATFPTVPVFVIFNPDNGPGPPTFGPQANFTTAIGQVISAGGSVLGYVDNHGNGDYTGTNAVQRPQRGTNSGSGPTGILDDVDNWLSWYPNLSGIFYDDIGYGVVADSVYQAQYTYVRSTLGMSWVFTNPGLNTPVQYFNGSVVVADNIAIYENDGWPTLDQVENAAGGGIPIGGFSQKAAISDNQTFDAGQFATMCTYNYLVYATNFPATTAYQNIPAALASQFAILAAESGPSASVNDIVLTNSQPQIIYWG